MKESVKNSRPVEKRRKLRSLFLLTVSLGVLLSSCTVLPSGAMVPAAGCRSDPLAGVYYPWRLHLIAPCITVSGRVDAVKVEPDHDWHVNLRLDPGQPPLVNWVNRLKKGGDLVVEVIPMDQERFDAPAVGEHITVTGAYVLDLLHGWREIHPVWTLNGRGGAQFSPAAARKSVAEGLDRR